MGAAVSTGELSFVGLARKLLFIKGCTVLRSRIMTKMFYQRWPRGISFG